MAALEMIPELELGYDVERPRLHVVTSTPRTFTSGRLVSERRAARARLVQRRRRIAVGVIAFVVFAALAIPGHAFGKTSPVGMSADTQSAATLQPGMVYDVQPGDTLMTIAKLANPFSPNTAFDALRTELHSSFVITGEHVLIP